MTRIYLYWTLQIICWSIYALASSIFMVITDRPELIPQQLLVILFLFACTHFLRFLIKQGDWLLLTINRLIPRLFLTTFLLAIFGYFVQVGLYFVFFRGTDGLDMSPFSVGYGILANYLLFLFWSLLYVSYHYISWFTSSRDIQLKSLKSQINPHFIFNALNSIRALIDEDPEKSKLAITQLSHLLRQSLMMDNKRLVPLSDELRTVKDYLDLETIRYEDRLRTRLDIDADVYNCQVPPMMVQTLVENGIKHGISNLRKGGELSLTARRVNGFLEMEIRNSGQIKSKAIVGKEIGYGVQNTRKRLELIYGNKASFELRNETDQNVIAILHLPQKQ